ncbi:unnamed protein product [Mytilus coruscus]|uniref:Uncharacterized protein n=1 Tax=Mytilus coruscus TaxID=42192 RepID=A0A6J8AV99_MYTCO|nr:unnamed protein product [Mytilus coruscus]
MDKSQWILSMPACADYNSAMQDLNGVGYCTSDQHKEATRARKERDRVDTLAILEYLSERNPFTNDVSLRNIETGVEAEPDVNVDKAESIGNKTLELMKGQKILNYSFKKSNQSITLAAKPKSKSDSDFLNTDIDPQLMFQRLTTAANGLFENTSEVFQYELCSVPSSMFDCNRLPREACKSNLADAIWACGSDCIHEIDVEGFQYVLDGGSLLQRLPWTHGNSFGDITQIHKKQALINMLCDKLKENDIRCKNATDDADLLIALTAVDCALSSEVVVIGEDTDLLVLLIHHVNQQCKRVIFKSDKMAINKKMKIWNIQQTKEFLGEDVCNLLPFLHSLTGCDSTSRLFGIGKGLALKKT